MLVKSIVVIFVIVSELVDILRRFIDITMPVTTTFTCQSSFWNTVWARVLQMIQQTTTVEHALTRRMQTGIGSVGMELSWPICCGLLELPPPSSPPGIFALHSVMPVNRLYRRLGPSGIPSSHVKPQKYLSADINHLASMVW